MMKYDNISIKEIRREPTVDDFTVSKEPVVKDAACIKYLLKVSNSKKEMKGEWIMDWSHCKEITPTEIKKEIGEGILKSLVDE